MESTLSSPCSRSDLPLSHQGAALAHLDSLPLMIWYSGKTALFLLARAAPTSLPSALSVAMRPLFLFRQAQYAQVFPLKPAPFCTLFAGLGSTIKSATFSSVLLLSDSHSVLATLCSHRSFFLFQTLWQIWQVLSSPSFLLLYQTTMGPWTLVSPRKQWS